MALINRVFERGNEIEKNEIEKNEIIKFYGKNLVENLQNLNPTKAYKVYKKTI